MNIYHLKLLLTTLLIMNYKQPIMKNKILITLLLLFSLNILVAQNEKKEKIKALKTAHITNELDLTSQEAEKFWPIYNASEEKRHDLRRQLRKTHQQLESNFDEISEQEAHNILTKLTDLQNQMHQEKNALIKTLKTAIPAKKIIKLKKAEDDFNRKLLMKFRDRRPPTDGKPPHRR